MFKPKSLQKNRAKGIQFPPLQFKINPSFSFKNALRIKRATKKQQNERKSRTDYKIFEENPEKNSSLVIKIERQSSPSATMLKNMLNKEGIQRQPSLTPKQWLNKSAIYFTKRQKQMFERQSNQIKQKRSILGQKFMERKQSFESYKKMKQILKDQEKYALLQDLEFKRQQRERENKIRQKQRVRESNFLHELNLAKVDMERRLKLQKKYEQLGLTKEKYSETEQNSHFMKMQQFKAKRNHMELLESRLVFLMNEKIQNTSEEHYLDQRMTSRSLLKDS